MLQSKKALIQHNNSKECSQKIHSQVRKGKDGRIRCIRSIPVLYGDRRPRSDDLFRLPCWSLGWRAVAAAAACTCCHVLSEHLLATAKRSQITIFRKQSKHCIVHMWIQKQHMLAVPWHWRPACWWLGPGRAEQLWHCRWAGRKWLLAAELRQCVCP